ncbi:MAG: ABC transporter substrate-binding protein [Microscillaceae bacterium]|nr:ABC transporter substrate-binding protein [Microscillaceae bacterium]
MQYCKFIFWGLILCPLLASAQSKKLYQTYTQAKQAFIQNQYETANSLFALVTQSGEENQLVEYAYYYLALSAQKKNDLKSAQQNYLRLLERYPNWANRDEVYYALADIAFQNQDIESALNYLNKIQATDFQRDIYHIKGYYISRMETTPLRLLQQNLPQDTLIAQILVDKIAARSENMDEIAFMNELIRELKLQKPDKRRIDRFQYIRETYKVAAMLPFDFDKLRKREYTSLSKIAVSMYQGIRLACKELDSLLSVDIKLFAYDVRKENTNSLNEMISRHEFDDMDFIIGPLFPDEFKKMADLAATQKINMINPISDDAKLLYNEFTYLFRPTAESQAEKVAQFVAQKFSSKNTLIFYDNLTANQELAVQFQKKAEAEGLKVLASQKVNTFDLAKIAEVLDQFKNSSIGSILVSSTSSLVAEEILKVLREKYINAPLFVPDAWLSKFNSIDLLIYENQQVHFISPEYLNTESARASQFIKNYKNFNLQDDEDPDIYAFLGYEMMYYFANLLQKFGTKTNYRTQLNAQGLQVGKLVEGIDFSNKNDNQFVPILKIVNGQTQLVNKPK